MGGVGGWVRTWNFHRGIEKKACGNSKDQLKKKWNFKGCSRKNDVEFPRYTLFFCKYNFIRTKALVLVKSLKTS